MRSFATASLVLLLLAKGGCLRITPTDGSLHCSAGSQKCPSGYYCASDNTCWHTGAAPDMAGDGVATCMVPSDCPPQAQPCILSACVQNICGAVNAPSGTVPAKAQMQGDCQRRICDDNGQVLSVADDTNVPSDPTGGCNTPSCKSGVPIMTPTSSGTSCQIGGVCNGAGVCAVCRPGNSQCAGSTIQNCSTDGQWMNGTVCRNQCTNGVCTGACSPSLDAPYCSGNTRNVCVGSSWQAMPCTNQACVNGACVGNCAPSPKTCSGNQVVWCDGSGNMQTQTCTACLNGACVDCNPNTSACCTAGSLAGHMTCDSTGHWGACTACGGNSYYSCSGTGVCNCSAPDPCLSLDCGNKLDGCGVLHSCGTCSSCYRCANNFCICAITKCC
jgi:hypothetical protein